LRYSGCLTCDPLDARTVRVADGEVLLVNTHRVVERVANDVDDTRIGKQRLDQADVPEVIGPLVNEGRRTAGQKRSNLLQVGPPGLAGLSRRQPRQGIGKTALLIQRARQVLDEGQLTGRFDPAVAGEHLFEQRAAGPRHSDDEDGIRPAVGRRR
jgi:hypothetical protein